MAVSARGKQRLTFWRLLLLPNSERSLLEPDRRDVPIALRGFDGILVRFAYDVGHGK
jgi:hypothetical protein